LWRSVVLSSAGTTLMWVLLMTLWLPVVNYSRTYRDVAVQIADHLPDALERAPGPGEERAEALVGGRGEPLLGEAQGQAHGHERAQEVVGHAPRERGELRVLLLQEPLAHWLSEPVNHLRPGPRPRDFPGNPSRQGCVSDRASSRQSATWATLAHFAGRCDAARTDPGSSTFANPAAAPARTSAAFRRTQLSSLSAQSQPLYEDVSWF